MKATAEESGIEAIIWLQKLANIEETEEQAREGWNAMNEEEKASTLAIFHLLKGE